MHALRSIAALILPVLCFLLVSCSTEPKACPANAACGCGGLCPADDIPLLYATTTSDQILAFSINSSGALQALPAVTGPANLASVTTTFNALLFGDQSSNSVYGDAVDQVTGALTALQGSPFSLGMPNGGPTSIMVGPYGYFYATEPNGTIVGYGTASEVGALGAPLPNSPYPAGVAPAQMASAAQSNSGPSAFFLYAADTGDPNGGILAYYLDPAGALSPIPDSPFPTLPNAQPTAVLYGAFYQSGSQVSTFLFVSLTAAAKVAVFSIDTNSGTLTPAPGSPFAVGNGPGALLEDDFNHLYVVNGVDHTVSALNLGSSGMLTAISSPVPAGTANGGIAYFAYNQLYVADTDSTSILIFNIDKSTGALTPSGAPFPVPIPPLQLAYVGP
jgi:6-phosphogluconolactonase